MLFRSRKKVAIVCALQHSPALCVFDEPTSGLDPLIQKEFFKILKERNAQGVTIFLSSHILSEVQRYCSRAAVIREGRIAACGDLAKLSGTSAKRITLTGADAETLRRLLAALPGTLAEKRAQRDDAMPASTGHPDIRDFHTGDNTVSFLFEGNIKMMMDMLPQISYTDITVTEPDLNEIFMHFYEQGDIQL